MERLIRFKFSPRKGLAAIHWMVNEKAGVDLHTLLKSCYFADKRHLNEHRRPVFGAVYRAMPFGPVPIEIYEMAKCDPLWLADLGLDKYPWRLAGYHLHLESNENPDVDSLSSSDMSALISAFRLSNGMSFNERTAATHGFDWQAAELGFMRYEDMIEETAEKPEIVSYLKDSARYIKI